MSAVVAKNDSSMTFVTLTMSLRKSISMTLLITLRFIIIIELLAVVGGNLLGFVGGCLSPDCSRMLGVGYGGSFHLWCRSDVKGEDTLEGISHSSYSASWLSAQYVVMLRRLSCPVSLYQ